MSKIKTVLCVFCITIMAFSTTVFAASNDKLLNYFKSTNVGAENIAKVERYLESNTVTDAQADAIIAKANEINTIMSNAGISNIEDLSALTLEEKQEVLRLANEAGAVIGISITYDGSSKEISFYKDGVCIDSISVNGTLPFTGNNVLIYGIIGTVIVAAGAMFVASNKKGLALGV